MIIKQGEFISFTPTELHARRQASPRAAIRNAVKAEATQSKAELLQEIERLVRENERLVLERDKLRDELVRQSLHARQAKPMEQPRETTAPETPAASAIQVENLRRKPLHLEGGAALDSEDPEYDLARVVVKWFWDDADEASVRLVHDALMGQGIRAIARDDAEDES